MKRLPFILLCVISVASLTSCASTRPSSSAGTAHKERAQKLESGQSPGSVVPPEETNR